MGNRTVLFLLIAFNALSILAQEPDFEWGHSFGGPDFDKVAKIIIDSEDNIISTGFYHDTVDFDPSSNIENRTALDGDEIFIQKLNSDGELVWVKTIGGLRHDVGNSLITDNNNNIYVTGYFNGTVDFDPGPEVQNLTANGIYDDIYVLKLNSDGELLWVNQVGGASFEAGLSITLDLDNNVYTTGYFTGDIDFDPGPGTHLLTSGGIFVQKLDSDGNFIWAKNMTGGTGFTRGKVITTDINNNIYLAGDFESTVDFDPGPASNIVTANGIDAFIVKLNSDGQFIWVKQIGGEHSDIITDITIDNNNLLATGYFFQSADFDPGPGVVNLTNGYSPDIYVLKLNLDGEFLWVRQFGGVNSQNMGEGIATDSKGDVFVTGTFAETIDFDPSSETNELTASGFRDSFILKLDSSGNFCWAQNVGGNNSTVGNSIAVESKFNGNDVVMTGAFRNVIDVDPTDGIRNLSSNGLNDFFILKLFDPLPSCTNISTPIDGAIDVSISTNIDWVEAENAMGYIISVGTTPGGTDIANREDVGKVTTYDPSSNFAENQYIYVTITPYNCVGEALNCSEESFLTESSESAPNCTTLSGPLNGATEVSTATIINWDVVANATGYYISIGTTPGGAEITNREDVGNVISYDPQNNFAQNQDIYVLVVPYNSVGEAINCLEESFLTESSESAPSCTTLNGPLNGATEVSIATIINWNAVANATGYYISIGTTPGGAEITNREDVGNMTSYDPPNNFAQNQDIYVLVVPYNSVGEAIDCNEEMFLTENKGIIIPKFFTPNNDGYNDYWQIEGISRFSNSDIYIFDRYGKLLKQLSAQSTGWDGKFNGRLMPTNDYWFKVNLNNGRSIFQSFTLKR